MSYITVFKNRIIPVICALLLVIMPLKVFASGAEDTSNALTTAAIVLLVVSLVRMASGAAKKKPKNNETLEKKQSSGFDFSKARTNDPDDPVQAVHLKINY